MRHGARMPRPEGMLAGAPKAPRSRVHRAMANRVATLLHRVTAGALLVATAYFGTALAYNMHTMYSAQKERQRAKEELMQSDVVRFSEGDLEKPVPPGSSGRSAGSESAE